MRESIRTSDLVCGGYLAAVGIGIVTAGKRIDGWETAAALHLASIAAIALLMLMHRRSPSVRVLAVVRAVYPVGVIAFAWSELDRLVPMLYGSYWATGPIIRADRLIFGGSPTVWLQRFYSPALDEFMNIFYSGYYFFMPIVITVFLLRRRVAELSRVITIAAFAFLACDILYYLLPALGPHMAEEFAGAHTREFGGYLFAGITREMQSGGGARGACFPSSHVVGAVVWTLASRRYEPALGRIIAPIAAGVPLATVYLGYHHAVDSLAGIILGLLLYRVSISILRLRGEFPLDRKPSDGSGGHPGAPDIIDARLPREPQALVCLAVHESVPRRYGGKERRFRSDSQPACRRDPRCDDPLGSSHRTSATCCRFRAGRSEPDL